MERSYTWTGVPSEPSRRAGGGSSCVLRRLIQEYVWNVYDHRWGSSYIICRRLLTVVWGGAPVPWHKDTSRDGQLASCLCLICDTEVMKCALTFEVSLSMFCHLLTGSATTSQSEQADCRNLAKVDFPTAGKWEESSHKTITQSLTRLILKSCIYTYQCCPRWKLSSLELAHL